MLLDYQNRESLGNSSLNRLNICQQPDIRVCNIFFIYLFKRERNESGER